MTNEADRLAAALRKRRDALIERISTFADGLSSIPLPGAQGDVAYELLRQAVAQIASDRKALSTPTATDKGAAQRARGALDALGWHFELRGGMRLKIDDEGGVGTGTSDEAVMYDALEDIAALTNAATPADHGEARALEAYRAAVRWIAADSWDGCSDCIRILQMARSLDDVDWTPDQHAEALKRLYERSGNTPIAPADPARSAEGERLREAQSSAEFHQRRGMLADVILAALHEYDEWMLDDDYNAQGCLDRVVRQLERARDVAALSKES